MKVTKRTYDKDLDKFTDIYESNIEFNTKNIPSILETIQDNNIDITSLHMSNNEEQPDHFSRVYNTIDQFYLEWEMADERMISQFGIACENKDYNFSLSFRLDDNKVMARYKSGLNIPQLMDLIEENCQKKNRTK